MVNNNIIIKQSLESVKLVVASVGRNNAFETELLNEDQLERLKGFSSQKRQAEFYHSRVLLNENFKEISYSEPRSGRILLNEGGISLSHSGEYVAVAQSKLCQVGVDIQVKTQKLHRISQKFVNESERIIAESTSDLNQLWAIKEAVFKRYAESHLPFKDIVVGRKENGTYWFTAKDLVTEPVYLFTKSIDNLAVACTLF